MIKVYVKKQSNYPIRAADVKYILKEFLEGKGITSDTIVHVGFVGEKKMVGLAKRHLGETHKLHDILSFPESDVKGNFIYPDDKIRLGEIVICYPKVVREASKDNQMIDDKIKELVEHGAMHLLGQHHE